MIFILVKFSHSAKKLIDSIVIAKKLIDSIVILSNSLFYKIKSRSFTL